MPEYRTALLVLLLLFVVSPAAGQEEAATGEEWKKHWDAAFEKLNSFGGEATPEQFREVAEDFGRAARAARKAGLPDQAYEAYSRQIQCLMKLWDYAAVLKVSYEILELQVDMGDRATEARHVTLMDVGYLEYATGNPHRGIPPLKKAAEWFRAHKNMNEWAECMVRLADAYWNSGQIALGLEAGEAARRHFAKSGDPLRRMEVLNVVSRIHLSLGNLEVAEELIKQGLALAKSSDPSYFPEFQEKLGRLCMLRRDWGKARKWFSAALKGYLEQYDQSRAALAHIQMARVEKQAGRFEQGRARLREAMKCAGADLFPRSRAHYILGSIHLELGELAKAREEFTAAAELAEEIGDDSLTAWAGAGLAQVSLREGKPEEAAEEIREPLAAVSRSVSGLSPLSAAVVRDLKQLLCNVAVQTAFAHPEPGVAFELLERTRACSLVFDLGGRDRMISADADPALRRRVEDARVQIVMAQYKLDAVAGPGKRGPAVREAAKSLKRARMDYRVACDVLYASFESGVLHGKGEFATLDSTRSSLGEGETLVLFAIGGERLRAMVVRKDGTKRYDLGPSEDMERRLRTLRKSLAGDDYEGTVAALRKQVFLPLGLNRGTDRVLVSPVGELATAPLSLLLPDCEVAFVPSATSRSLLRKKAGEKVSAVLAVGDPRYEEGKESRKVFARLHRGADLLLNLPESRLEVELVTPRKTDERLLGKDATESRFREVLGQRKRWRAVHFACHGLVNLENPGWSSLALTPVKDVDDGYLAVGEIVTMRIPADLAVLSACSTAVGPTMRGEGLIALPGAFHHAGTPRVLASLWKVEDKAAREMMDAFYRLWNPQDGKPRIGAAAALKKAQQILKDKGYEHPRHWAAWVLWGLPD